MAKKEKTRTSASRSGFRSSTMPLGEAASSTSVRDRVASVQSRKTHPLATFTTKAEPPRMRAARKSASSTPLIALPTPHLLNRRACIDKLSGLVLDRVFSFKQAEYWRWRHAHSDWR